MGDRHTDTQTDRQTDGADHSIVAHFVRGNYNYYPFHSVFALRGSSPFTLIWTLDLYIQIKQCWSRAAFSILIILNLFRCPRWNRWHLLFSLLCICQCVCVCVCVCVCLSPPAFSTAWLHKADTRYTYSPGVLLDHYKIWGHLVQGLTF